MSAFVESINRAADVWWAYVAPAAWQAALVGLLLLAVVAFGRRWPSPVRFAILALALLKFAVPPLAAVPSGVFSQFALENERHANVAASKQPEVALAIPSNGPSTGLPKEWQTPVMSNARDLRVPDFQPSERSATPTETAAAPVISAAPPCPALGAKAYLMLLHLTGALAMFGWIAIQYRRVLRITHTAKPVIDGPLYQQFGSLCSHLGLRRRPQLLLTTVGHEPFSFGTFWASVVLPAPLVEQLSVEQLRATLAHELAHHRRGDLWLNWLQVVLCAVWWFHPVLWLLNRAMRATREDCCDDLLLADALVGDDAYCGTLLQVAAAPIRAGKSPLALTMSDSPHPLGRRFRRIMDSTLCRWPKLPVSAIAALIVLAAVLLPGLRRTSVAADAPAEKAVAKSESPAKESPQSDAPSKPLTKTVELTGKVVDERGKPVSGISVTAIDYDNDPVVGKSDADGGFRLRINRGRPILVASNADETQQGFFEFDDGVRRGSALPAAKIAIGPARSIEIRLIDDEGNPVSDAVVGVVGSYHRLASGRSSQQGVCKLRVAANAPLQSIYAFKSGIGLDYLTFPGADRKTTSDLPQPPDLSRPITMKLTGAKTVRIKLVDPKDQPIAGVGVSPWLFQKPEWNQRDDLNTSGVPDFVCKTGADGVATFDWIPTWDKGTLIFWPSDDDWNHARIEWEPAKDRGVKVVQLQRLVPVRGHVRHADGRPAAGILVAVQGGEYPGESTTNDMGQFEIRVAPNGIYSFVVTDDRFVAPPVLDIAVKPDTPLDGIDLELLKSATRLHGRLTLGPDKKPWPGQSVNMTPLDSNGAPLKPFMNHFATTNAEGRYSYAVGPGIYGVGIANLNIEQRVTVTDQKELVCDLHASRKPTGMITVHVVDGSNPPKPVPHAKVMGVSVSCMWHGNLEATTNDKGWFRVERALDKMIVYANNKDKTLAGSLTISGDDTEITIPIQPTGSAKGQLIDAPTGKIAANRPIRLEVFYHYELPNKSGFGSSWLAASTKTDAEGRFEITGLTPDQTYQMSVPMYKEGDPIQDQHSDRIGAVTAKSGETVNLGILKFRGEMMPNEAIGVALANRDPVDQRMTEWANEGRKQNKRTLLMFWPQEGGQRLQEILRNDHKGYLMISCQVDGDKFEAARVTFSRKWNLTLTQEPWPLFCVLGDDGKTVAVKNTQEFAPNGKIDDRLVVAFLQQHARRKANNDADDAAKPTEPPAKEPAPTPAATNNTVPTAAQVLAMLKKRRDSVQNLELHATWEEYDEGDSMKWEDGSIYRDNQEHIRVRYHYGSGALASADKKHAQYSDESYNGSFTVNINDDPTLDRQAKPYKPEDIAKATEHYRCVLIYNDKWPHDRSNAECHRNPFICMDVVVIGDLDELLAAGKAVTVQPVAGQQGVYELSYKFDTKRDPDNLTHRVVVDGAKGWVVTRHEQFFPNGKSGRLSTCEYQRGEGDLWTPTSGRFVNYWGKDTPQFDWRFNVKRVVVNNPRFDKGIFDTKLEFLPLRLLTKTVKGTVAYSNGVPVKGATVRIDVHEGSESLIAMAEHPTDRFGSFTIRGVPHRLTQLMAYIEPPPGEKDRNNYSKTVKVSPDETNVIITLDTKPIAAKK